MNEMTFYSLQVLCFDALAQQPNRQKSTNSPKKLAAWASILTEHVEYANDAF